MDRVPKGAGLKLIVYRARTTQRGCGDRSRETNVPKIKVCCKTLEKGSYGLHKGYGWGRERGGGGGADDGINRTTLLKESLGFPTNSL